MTYDHDRYDDDDSPRRCQWCHGTGGISVERSGPLKYRCPDCDGSGRELPPEEESEEMEADEARELEAITTIPA